MKMEPHSRMTIRIPNRLRDELRQRAAADRRTESDYARKVLWEHVEANTQQTLPFVDFPANGAELRVADQVVPPAVSRE
jgi:plasmid stability protein